MGISAVVSRACIDPSSHLNARYEVSGVTAQLPR